MLLGFYEMKVLLGGANACMAHQLLYRTYVNSPTQKHRTVGMPERIQGYVGRLLGFGSEQLQPGLLWGVRRHVDGDTFTDGELQLKKAA